MLETLRYLTQIAFHISNHLNIVFTLEKFLTCWRHLMVRWNEDIWHRRCWNCLSEN